MFMTTNQPFCYDPDFRRDPKDARKPYCLRCQKNLDTAKAVAVTANEETWMAVEGHDNDALVQGASNKVIGNGWIGQDCMKILRRQAYSDSTNARSLLK